MRSEGRALGRMRDNAPPFRTSTPTITSSIPHALTIEATSSILSTTSLVLLVASASQPYGLTFITTPLLFTHRHLIGRPVQAFSQPRDRHIEMSSPANRSLEAF
ncbi:hypothetical protein Q8A73_022073 [Channa argus]|nr:hypothetical protein Q8A73_022073 [Channa argus]